MTRRPDRSDVSDEEWAFAAPYLSLLPQTAAQTAAQRRHELREVFNALRWMVRSGARWRMLPVHFPPWEAVYQQTRRWIAAGCFEAIGQDLAIVQDLRVLVRAAAGRGWSRLVAAGRKPQPSTAMIARRTLRARVESGSRAGVDGHKVDGHKVDGHKVDGHKVDGHKQVRGSKVPAVVESRGTLLALAVTPANEDARQRGRPPTRPRGGRSPRGRVGAAGPGGDGR